MWQTVILVTLIGCASAPDKPKVSIEGFETGPATKSSKSQTYGTDLGIEKTKSALARPKEKEKSYQEPRIPEEQSPAGDLAKLLELEISFYRHPNDEEVLKEMIEYADTYKDPNMAQRAFEMAKYMHNSADALAAALLWITLEPSSSPAQNNYIRELIIQSKYPKAFDFMASRLDRGLPADFRLIGSFLTPQSEQQMRTLISTYDKYLQSYPFAAGNLREGRHITEYKLAEFLFYNQRLTDSLRVLNRMLPEKTVQANVRTAATSLKARIYYLTQQPAGDSFYEEEIKKDNNNVLLKIYYALYLLNTQRRNVADELLTQLLKSKNDDATVYLLTTVAQDRGLPKLRNAGLAYYKKVARKNDLGYMRLALLAANSGNYALVESFVSGIKEDSDYTETGNWLLLQVIVQTKEFYKSEGILEEIYRRDRNAYLAIVGRYVNRLATEGAKAEAEKTMTTAESLLPLEKSILLAKAYMYYELKDTASMIKVFELLTELDNQDPHILNGYGYALTDTNIRLKQARELIEAALITDPDSAAYTDSLGWLEYRANNLDRAHELLDWAYRQNPDAEIAAHLGEVLWRKKEYEQASYVWLKAYENDPYSAPLLKTLTRFNINPRKLNPNIQLFRPRY